ncbi:MAG TPA: hypothetical protein VJ695_02430 [Nitrososphaera sp.]|nr:hypothetical protein [Nitrososphaera sp.]
MSRKKKMLNKRTVIIVSCLATIPLTVFLVAVADRRRRRSKSQEPNVFLSHTNSQVNVVRTSTATITTASRQQQHNEETHSLSPLLQGSKTIEATPTAIATTSTNIHNGEKEEDIATTTSPLSVAVLYHPREPFTTENNTMKSSSSETSKEEELARSDDAKKARESLRELIVSAIKDAKDSAKGRGKELKEQTGKIADTVDKNTVDRKNIQPPRNNLDTLLGLFEETIKEIRKEYYDEQIKLLDSYRDLLQTQIKVVNARRRMAGKLKPGA